MSCCINNAALLIASWWAALESNFSCAFLYKQILLFCYLSDDALHHDKLSINFEFCFTYRYQISLKHSPCAFWYIFFLMTRLYTWFPVSCEMLVFWLKKGLMLWRFYCYFSDGELISLTSSLMCADSAFWTRALLFFSLSSDVVCYFKALVLLSWLDVFASCLVDASPFGIVF